MMPTNEKHRDSYQGCLLGLAIGDAWCAGSEGGPLERLVWRWLGRTSSGQKRYTDDTQMSLDVAHSVLSQNGVEQDHLAKLFAHNCRWSRGYGPGASKLLRMIQRGTPWQVANRTVFRDGSYGNGAAMRAPVIGLFWFGDLAQTQTAVTQISEITHAHPLAIQGALLITIAVQAALKHESLQQTFEQLRQNSTQSPYQSKIEIAEKWLINKSSPTVAEIRQQLGNRVAAVDSVATAIYLSYAKQNSPLEELISTCNQLGGDTDTIAAMACAIWGAYHGRKEIPDKLVEAVEEHALIGELAVQIADWNWSRFRYS